MYFSVRTIFIPNGTGRFSVFSFFSLFPPLSNGHFQCLDELVLQRSHKHFFMIESNMHGFYKEGEKKVQPIQSIINWWIDSVTLMTPVVSPCLVKPNCLTSTIICLRLKLCTQIFTFVSHESYRVFWGQFYRFWLLTEIRSNLHRKCHHQIVIQTT